MYNPTSLREVVPAEPGTGCSRKPVTDSGGGGVGGMEKSA